MTVLMINRSPNKNRKYIPGSGGNEKKYMKQRALKRNLVHVGKADIRGCIACNTSGKTGKCVFDDLVNELAVKYVLLDEEDCICTDTQREK